MATIEWPDLGLHSSLPAQKSSRRGGAKGDGLLISLLFTIVLVILTFFFADSVLTPLLLLLWKKAWLLLLKLQALLTKKNVVQALVQSLLLATKALLRLINKTITVWILPLLLTRRQRYWLHHALIDTRKKLRRQARLRWVRWRRQALWLKVLTLGPAIIVAAAFFIGSGMLLAGLFGVSFIVPWIGGLPLAAVVYSRRALARLGLFVLERLGAGIVVNKTVDQLIDLIWWKTPEPAQHRFDAWWQRLKMRMRRRVIGPRRQVTQRMARLRLGKRDDSADEVTIRTEGPEIPAMTTGHVPSSDPAPSDPSSKGEQPSSPSDEGPKAMKRSSRS